MAENDFDAGINTSTAWTEHLDGASLSDEEQLCETGRQARALYAFEGKPEFRELTVEAGDDLDVIKERIPDGWSLVRRTVDGQIGLLPRSYYTVCSPLTTHLISLYLLPISLLQTLSLFLLTQPLPVLLNPSNHRTPVNGSKASLVVNPSTGSPASSLVVQRLGFSMALLTNQPHRPKRILHAQALSLKQKQINTTSTQVPHGSLKYPLSKFSSILHPNDPPSFQAHIQSTVSLPYSLLQTHTTPLHLPIITVFTLISFPVHDSALTPKDKRMMKTPNQNLYKD